MRHIQDGDLGSFFHPLGWAERLDSVIIAAPVAISEYNSPRYDPRTF